MPDDFKFFLPELPGEKHIFFAKNTDHMQFTGQKQHVAVLSTFLYMVLSGEERPHMEWTIDDDNGTIDLVVD